MKEDLEKVSYSKLIKKDIYNFETKRDSENNPVFLFKTFEDSVITISLFADSEISEKYTVRSISIHNEAIRKADILVRNTIAHILYSYLSFYPEEILFYVIDFNDGKEEHRKRLFSIWRSHFNRETKGVYKDFFKMENIHLGLFISETTYEGKSVKNELLETIKGLK